MTDTPEPRVERLSRELAAAFWNRADLYRLILEALIAELGPRRAETVLAGAIEARGREVARQAFAGFGPNQARAVGEAFLAASPDSGRLYPADVERTAAGIRFRVRRCPLKDAWVAAGVPEERLATLCRIAGAFDRGLFETVGVGFANTTWSPGHGSDCCHIELRDRDSDVGE